jgi:hypothetical protein
MDRNYMIMK